MAEESIESVGMSSRPREDYSQSVPTKTSE